MTMRKIGDCSRAIQTTGESISYGYVLLKYMDKLTMENNSDTFYFQIKGLDFFRMSTQDKRRIDSPDAVLEKRL